MSMNKEAKKRLRDSLQPDQRIVNELVSRIVDSAHPLRIILFGSAARGQMQSSSDLDVLVVMPDGTHRLNTMGLLFCKTADLGVPIDFVVTTPTSLEKYKDQAGLIYRAALRDGKELFAAI